jgi:hypothetical protein
MPQCGPNNIGFPTSSSLLHAAITVLNRQIGATLHESMNRRDWFRPSRRPSLLDDQTFCPPVI